MSEFDHARILDEVKNAVKPNSVSSYRTVTEYEAYYLDRHHERPLPVLFFQLDDAEQSMFYIDPKTARVVESYDSGSRWNRSLYHGLHSLNFPWLYRYRPLWDILVLFLLLGGIALCVTSMLLAWRVVRRMSFAPTRARRSKIQLWIIPAGRGSLRRRLPGAIWLIRGAQSTTIG